MEKRRASKSKRGRPATGRSPILIITMGEDQLRRVDRWRRVHVDEDFEPLKRPAAIRALVQRGLGK